MNGMDNRFFENPILNSPYAYPSRHWELDRDGQPTQTIVESRRRAEFISPVPKPRKRGSSASQETLVFDEGKGLSTREQQYERHTEIINGVRREVDDWRRKIQSWSAVAVGYVAGFSSVRKHDGESSQERRVEHRAPGALRP